MKDIRIFNNYVTFWGSELSNFFPCKIRYKNYEFESSEQLFMYLKAITFKDNDIVEKILNETVPNKAKMLGRKIKGFNQNVWEKYREKAMYLAVYLKFSQNEFLKNFLFSPEFENKHFVEGSPYDKIWGVGISFDDDKIKDKENWNGLNLLGKCLDNVKIALLDEKSKNI